MNKIIKSGNDARDSLFKGVEKLYEAVSSTLGPHGSTVVIENIYGEPLITKDGVTVARNISFKDQYENLGVNIVQQVASKTDLVVGDGTTTATVLTYYLYKNCIDYLKCNHNKLELLNNLDKIKDYILDKLDKDSIKITSKTQLNNIAHISSNSDEVISKLVIDAFDKAGDHGSIITDINNSPYDEILCSDGMKLFTGYRSPQFINTTSSNECVLDEPLVLLTEDNLLSAKDVIKVMEIAAKAKKPLLLMAPCIDREALGTLILNKERGNLECCAIQYPGYGVIISELINDLSLITGAKVISYAKGSNLASVTLEDLGKLKKCKIGVNQTILTRDPDINEDKVIELVSELKKRLETCLINEAPHISDRLSKLCGKVVEVLIGGATEIIVKERKDRVVDAISATRAALDEGIIVGSGKELLNIANNDEFIDYCNKLDKELYPYIRNVLIAPFIKIMEASNINYVDKLDELIDEKSGYNAKTGEFGNLFEMGIIDPVKVTKTGIMNSFSVVSTLLSTNVVLINEK